MKTSHIRIGRNITNVTNETPVNQAYPSINAAKRESAAIQRANGGLGKGSVSVR